MILMQKHKILTFLLSLVVSLLLWVYAVTVLNPDDVISVRGVSVRLIGTNELQMSHLMITGGEYQTVDVEVSGRRSDLKELNSTTLEAVADVSKIDGAGVYELSWSLDPPASVASGDIRLVNSSANKIKVKVSEVQRLPEIPVKVEYTGVIAEGCVREAHVLNKTYVSLSGPAEEVDNIEYARVIVDLNNTKSSLDQELEYDFINEAGEVVVPSNYVTIDDPTVRVMVPVYCYKQVKLTLDIIPGGGATVEDAVYTIDPPVIGVIGDEDSIRNMPNTLVIKQIMLAEVLDTVTYTVTPTLPSGVSNRDTENAVEITISLPGLEIGKVLVSCAQIQRKDDSVPLDFAVSKIPVTIRGKAEKIALLDSSMFRITADMENDYDPETKTVRVNVTLKEETGCVVLGTYTVPVVDRIEEPVPEMETTPDVTAR